MACHVFPLQTPIRQDRAAPRPRGGSDTPGEWREQQAPSTHVKDMSSGPAAHGARPPRGALERSWSRSSDPGPGAGFLGADGAAGAGDPQERGREREAEWLRDGGGARTMRGEQRRSWQDPDVLGCDWRDGMPGLGRVCECVQVCVSVSGRGLGS